MEVTERLSRFAADARFEDLPDEVRHEVRRHAIDCIGVAVAAAGETPGRQVADVIGGLGGRGARLLGGGARAAVTDAAWANGTLAHLMDFDDTGFSHPTACILPAVLALAEARGLRGDAVMCAMAVGYEVFEQLSRMGRAHEPMLRKRGVHPTSVYGCPAAAAAAAKALGLDADRIAVAIGLGASASGGVSEQFGTWGKGTQAGNAARAGVTGALLAERGYQASRRVLEGRYGLLNAVVGKGNYDLSLLGVGLGERWAITEPGLNIKQYPACAAAQRAIAATLELRAAIDGALDEVESIEIAATESLLDAVHVGWPRYGFEGRFSLHFCVVMAMVDGDVTLDSFHDESLTRSDVIALRDRVTVRNSGGGYAPGEDRRATPVRLRRRDGIVEERSVTTPRGTVGNPMSDAELRQKYIAAAARVLPVGSVDESYQLLSDLERVRVTRVLDSLTPGDQLGGRHLSGTLTGSGVQV